MDDQQVAHGRAPAADGLLHGFPGPAAVPRVVVGTGHPVPAHPVVRVVVEFGADGVEQPVGGVALDAAGRAPRQVADVEIHALFGGQPGKLLVGESGAQRRDHRPQSDEREQQQRDPQAHRGRSAVGDQRERDAPQQDEVDDHGHTQEPDQQLGANLLHCRLTSLQIEQRLDTHRQARMLLDLADRRAARRARTRCGPGCRGGSSASPPACRTAPPGGRPARSAAPSAPARRRRRRRGRRRVPCWWHRGWAAGPFALRRSAWRCAPPCPTARRPSAGGAVR